MQGPGIGPARGVALLPPGLHEPRHRPRHRSALAALQVTFSFNLPLIDLSWISLSSHPWISQRPLYLSWDSKMLGKEMPSLTWKAANHLAIAYHPDKVNLEEIIPVAIEKDGQYSVYTKFEILIPNPNKETFTVFIHAQEFLILLFCSGTTSLGTSGGRGSPYTFRDPLFTSILLSLVPEQHQPSKDAILHIDLDKFVFFRVILTYLYKNSLKFV